MNANRQPHASGTIERALRQALSQPGSAIQEAAAWDGSAVSRFLSGQQGVLISKIDALVNAAGYVLVSRKYLDAIGTLGEVGMYCHCARAGAGECGPARQGQDGEQQVIHFRGARP
ncbi:DNA-binding protein [Acidovorax sp. SUPP1855]|nr:DNA-binding protein [Acidovorax sp. SUPP1855]